MTISRPSYDCDEIGVGVVHFGVGGFRRAHQAMYIDRLLEMGLAKDWGIWGVGLMAADRKMGEVMAAPRARIISLTIAEGGYIIDGALVPLHRDGSRATLATLLRKETQ